MSVSAVPTSSTGMVGNPKRTRGLNAAVLAQPKPDQTAALVGNPRRTRGLQAEDSQAA
ncbi:MAG TPA: hypothetical protein VIC62_09645 [Nakamurella sp.]